MSQELQRAYYGGFVGKTHYFALRVYIEDTDLGGVVYHANYLRYLERARSDLLRCLGIDQRQALAKGMGIYAVSEMHIAYRRPAKLDDDLVVHTILGELGGASCGLSQKILRADELIVEAKVTAAFLTPAGRPSRHPAEWRDKFRALLPCAEKPPPSGGL